MQSTDRRASPSTLQEMHDVYTAHFTRLIWRADRVCDTDVKPDEDPEFAHYQMGQPSLVVDNGTSSAPGFDGTSSRSINLLHQVAALLSKTPGYKEIWQIMGAYSVAERLG